MKVWSLLRWRSLPEKTAQMEKHKKPLVGDELSKECGEVRKALAPQPSTPSGARADGEMALLHPPFPDHGGDNLEQDISVQISGTLWDSWLTFPSGYSSCLSERSRGAWHSGRAGVRCVTGLTCTRCPSPSDFPVAWTIPITLTQRYKSAIDPPPVVSWTEKALQTGRVKEHIP